MMKSLGVFVVAVVAAMGLTGCDGGGNRNPTAVDDAANTVPAGAVSV